MQIRHPRAPKHHDQHHTKKHSPDDEIVATIRFTSTLKLLKLLLHLTPSPTRAYLLTCLIEQLRQNEDPTDIFPMLAGSREA